MSLDTKYRPLHFDDVLGQEGTCKVLRQFVRTGTGFHQSYLFCGSHGGGKTTIGRILARALLCEDPQDGNPCDACSSCKSILERGSSECFVEVDAATSSGKDDIRQIVDLIQYDTFSGRRRIYLFDESHRLSKDALDALLKPMEDTAAGTEDKLLVCIFCTTEPEKMRATIFSRCAPAFVIRPVSPEKIADRLAQVCKKEGIPHEQDALVAIAEVVECHIRDALKSVEGVSMLGGVTLDNVRSYLRLNANKHYLRVLAYLGRDLPQVLAETQALQELVSPTTVYERLAELAMLAYRVGNGVGKVPSYWDDKLVRSLWTVHQSFLLQVASVLAIRPGHPTFSMLECDLSALHFSKTGAPVFETPAPAVRMNVVQALPSPVPAPMVQTPVPVAGSIEPVQTHSPPKPVAGPLVTRGGVYVDPRGINRNKEQGVSTATNDVPPLSVAEYKHGLLRLVSELTVDTRRARSTR